MLQEQRNTIVTAEQRCADIPETVTELDRATSVWHSDTPAPADPVLALHLANFELWHLEDTARDAESGDAVIASTKRAIDQVNQRRNDTVEAIDAELLLTLSARGLPRPDARLHSETPGQMLDRLSILSLKLFHTAIEAGRDSAGPEHRNRNQARFAALQEQRDDLADCFRALWDAIGRGEYRFKQYRQWKMYNDPTLNPALYARRGQV